MPTAGRTRRSTPPRAASRQPTTTSRAGRNATSAVLVGSGFTALVYETLWVKQLGRVVGVDVQAVTLALAAFFAGLALGAAWFGRRADDSRHPLRLYAVLECGAAVLGAATTLILAHLAAPYAALRDAIGPWAWTLPFALVGGPAFLMGGTLPAILRAARPEHDAVAPDAGRLYAANTFGAVAGTIATPFMLVPWFGITGTGLLAAALGLTMAGAALGLDRHRRESRPQADPGGPAAPLAPSRDARVALALYAISGGIALGYEVVWSEALVQFLSTRVYAFAVMLATYLTGLGVGSAVYARWFARRVTDPWLVLGALLAAAGTTAIGALAILGPWLPDTQALVGTSALRLTGNETVEVVVRFVVGSCAVLIVPTLLLGAAFPVVAHLAAGPSRAASGVGATSAINTAGGIVGTMVTGFLMIPTLGLVRSMGLLAVVGAVVGAMAMLRSHARGVRWVAGGVVVIVSLLAITTPQERLARLLAERRGGELVHYEETAGGTVAVLQQRPPVGSGEPFRRLYIQGVSNSGDAFTSLRYMRLQALLPLIVHPAEPRSALVVGFGTGITAGALLAYPTLETRTVAELLPAVVRAGTLFSGNFQAATATGLDIRIGDGRQQLLRQPQRYDLITLEPPPPSAAGVANLYSREFYELCRARLTPGGLMAQWWPLPAQNDEDSRSLVRSFLDVFPHASAWTTELHEVLLIGSTAPLPLDGNRVAARFAIPSVRTALEEIGVESPEALLALWLTDRSGLERYAGNAPAVTDDRPLIEHAAWVRRGELTRVLPRLLDSATDVPLPRGTVRIEDVDQQRHELLDFYDASLMVMEGRREQGALALREVLGRDPDNPYYRWVITGARTRGEGQ